MYKKQTMDAHKHADRRLVEVDYFSFYGSSNISEVAQKLQRNFVSSLEVMVATKSDPNCVEPACADKMEFFKTAVSKKISKAAAHPTPANDCPLDRQELGNATWGLLHSMGIYYPDKPSPEYQAKAKTFIEALALMYPCVDCANDFQKEIVKSPPRVESRTSFSMWLCEQHNIVNRKIHKPVFKCTMENLEERWRKGKPSCWGEDGDEDSTQDTLM